MNTPTYIREAVIVSFWETITSPYAPDEMVFKKRYYTKEDKAREFIEKLANSGRRVQAIQLKINYRIEIK